MLPIGSVRIDMERSVKQQEGPAIHLKMDGCDAGDSKLWHPIDRLAQQVEFGKVFPPLLRAEKG